MNDLIIIGAGPAGASAAIFAAKAGKKTIVIDNDKSMTKRAWVENHYGVKEISGPDLIEIGKEQALKFGAEVIQSTVEKIEKIKHGFQVVTDDNGHFEAKHVLIASGISLQAVEASGIETKAGTEPRIKIVIAVDADGKTNIPGIWAAGTCAGVSVHTIITAGDGAKVAVNIISELNGERYVDHDLLK